MSLVLQCSDAHNCGLIPRDGNHLTSKCFWLYLQLAVNDVMDGLTVPQHHCLIIPRILKGDDLGLSDRKSSLHELLLKIVKLLLEALQPQHVFQHYTQDVDNTNPLKVFAIDVMPDF